MTDEEYREDRAEQVLLWTAAYAHALPICMARHLDVEKASANARMMADEAVIQFNDVWRRG
jgi:hypothetical protein